MYSAYIEDMYIHTYMDVPYTIASRPSPSFNPPQPPPGSPPSYHYALGAVRGLARGVAERQPARRVRERAKWPLPTSRWIMVSPRTFCTSPSPPSPSFIPRLKPSVPENLQGHRVAAWFRNSLRPSLSSYREPVVRIVTSPGRSTSGQESSSPLPNSRSTNCLLPWLSSGSVNLDSGPLCFASLPSTSSILDGFVSVNTERLVQTGQIWSWLENRGKREFRLFEKYFFRLRWF